MELVGGGDHAAFDELYDRYARRLLFYFHRMLGGEEAAAHDALHDLFLKLVERPELYAPGRRFSTWIFSIAHNMCKNEYRRRDARESIRMPLDEIPSGQESILDRIDREAFGRALAAELDTLPEELRATFILRHHEGLGMQEIAEILDCPLGTVKSRLFNIVRRLADRLDEYHPNDHENERLR